MPIESKFEVFGLILVPGIERRRCSRLVERDKLPSTRVMIKERGTLSILFDNNVSKPKAGTSQCGLNPSRATADYDDIMVVGWLVLTEGSVEADEEMTEEDFEDE